MKFWTGLEASSAVSDDAPEEAGVRVAPVGGQVQREEAETSGDVGWLWKGAQEALRSRRRRCQVSRDGHWTGLYYCFYDDTHKVDFKRFKQDVVTEQVFMIDYYFFFTMICFTQEIIRNN